MGGQISRKRDSPANAAETGAVAEEQTQTKEVEVKEGTATSVAAEEPVPASAPVADAQPESVVKDAPVKPEALVSVSKLSPSESEPVVAESQPAPETEAVPKKELAPKTESIPDPEITPKPVDVGEPEPTSNPKPEVETALEAILESSPAEAVKEKTDTLTQESAPESVISSPASIDVGISDAIPQPTDTPPSPSPANATDISAAKEGQASCEGTSESMEPKVKLEQVAQDVKEENVPIAEVNPPNEQM